MLINLSGRDPDWRRHVRAIEAHGPEQHVLWRDGRVTVVPPDDLPHTYGADRQTRRTVSFSELEPDQLHYIDPHDLGGIDYPWRWGFAPEPAPKSAFFPPWQDATVRWVRERAPEVSLHAEVFSPFSQFMELLDFEPALMALIDDPVKVEACLEALAEGTAELMSLQARAGADAILISSAFAGAGFISTNHYRRFVLPFEHRIIEQFRAGFPAVPFFSWESPK